MSRVNTAFVSWSEYTTFASHYTNSGALLTNYSTPQESHAILARSVRLNNHKESKGKNKNKTSNSRKHPLLKLIFVHIVAWETGVQDDFAFGGARWELVWPIFFPLGRGGDVFCCFHI